jgi:hypothetical protein
MNFTVTRLHWSLVTGGLLIAAGILVPSRMWIDVLRKQPDSLEAELLAGATLFRAGLILLGGFLTALAVFWKEPARPHPRVAVEPERPAYLILLGAILAAAFGLRLYKLDSGLWLDEILTFINYARLPLGEIVSTYANENQHFLYSIMAHVCFLIFGENTWALRFPAVVFGVASIGALYLLGRQVASAREALFAAALLAFSYHHIWFSQNARGYSGLLFWTIFSSWLFLRGLDNDRPRTWVFYAISVTLGVYTHINMAFVIAGQLGAYLWTLWSRRNENWPHRWTGLIFGFCLGGLLTFQLHAIVLPQIHTGMAKTVSVVDAWKRPLWTLLEILEGLRTNFAGVFAAAAALTVFGAGLWSYALSRPVLLQLFLIPPVAGAALVMAVGHHLWPRFFFFAFGFGALIVIRGAVVIEQAALRLLRSRMQRPVTPGPILCSGLLLVSAASMPFAFGPKQDYGGALEFVESIRQPGDAIVTAGLASFTYKTLYKTDWQPVETIQELNRIRAGADRTIVLYTLQPVLESMYPDIMAVLKQDFQVLRQFRGTLQGGTVSVCVAAKGQKSRI